MWVERPCLPCMAGASSLCDKWGVLEIQPCHEPMDDKFYGLKIEPDAIRYVYDFLILL